MIRKIPASLIAAVATTLVAAAGASPNLSHWQPTQPSSAQSYPALPGIQSRWAIDFRAAMAQSSATLTAMHMIGTWQSTIIAVRAGEYDTQLQLADVHFAGDAVKGVPPASLLALQNRLSLPFWATYRNDGGLLSMHFFREVPPSDRNLLQMMATELQLVQPGVAHQNANQNNSKTEDKTWTAQERDSIGEYSALYLEPQTDRILKRKLKYLYTDGVAGAPADAVRVSVEQSEIAFSMTHDHRVQAVDGTDHVRMSLSPDKSQQLTASTEFHLNQLHTAYAPELVGSLKRAGADVVESSIVTQRPNSSMARAEADDRLLNGFTTKSILNAAFAKESAESAQPDRLTALFRRRLEAVAEAKSLLIENGPRKTVTNALGAAGSPAAVAVLSELSHDKALPENLRVDAIVAFVQMKHPTTEAMQVPLDLTGDSNAAVQSAARMIIGALARSGRPEHAAEAEAIDSALLALYRNAHDTRERADLIGALGNSAGPAAAQAIESALNDPAVPIRSAAARALRLIEGPNAGQDADRRLAKVIVSDSDPSVRADAIFATRFRHPLSSVLADALLRAVNADQFIYVRSDALAVLLQNQTASPQIPEALARIASSDPDPGIRRQAKKAINASTTSVRQ